MNIEDKLEKIINDIEKVNTKLETIQTETVFYKTKAYNLMNYKGFPVQKIGKRKVVESQALQRWGAIGRQLYI